MQEGDHIILSFSFDELYNIILKSGEKLDCRYGHFLHDDMIGNAYGTKILNA